MNKYELSFPVKIHEEGNPDTYQTLVISIRAKSPVHAVKVFQESIERVCEQSLVALNYTRDHTNVPA